ncbi:MAG: hypothetical protein R2694_05450 [Ilumatobacteraceae bacterium]
MSFNNARRGVAARHLPTPRHREPGVFRGPPVRLPLRAPPTPVPTADRGCGTSKGSGQASGTCRDEFKTIKVEITRGEQRAIADYLDAETARIDALIAKKQQLITLLEGRRLSVLEARLHHELTGHPAVPVRHLASISGGLTLGGATVRGAEVRRPYLRVANVQDGYLDLGDVAEIDVSPEQARRFALQDGDVLMLEGNGNPDNLGRGTIWRSEIPGCLHQNHIHAVRPDRSLLVPEFFNFVVRTPFARSELTGGGGQVSIATLSKSDIAALRLPLPPIAKQRAIVDSVRRELSYVDASLRAAAQQIELLAEHRQALITATVTGQHSVPGNS